MLSGIQHVFIKQNVKIKSSVDKIPIDGFLIFPLLHCGRHPNEIVITLGWFRWAWEIEIYA